MRLKAFQEKRKKKKREGVYRPDFNLSILTTFYSNPRLKFFFNIDSKMLYTNFGMKTSKIRDLQIFISTHYLHCCLC